MCRVLTWRLFVMCTFSASSFHPIECIEQTSNTNQWWTLFVSFYQQFQRIVSTSKDKYSFNDAWLYRLLGFTRLTMDSILVEWKSGRIMTKRLHFKRPIWMYTGWIRYITLDASQKNLITWYTVWNRLDFAYLLFFYLNTQRILKNIWEIYLE